MTVFHNKYQNRHHKSLKPSYARTLGLRCALWTIVLCAVRNLMARRQLIPTDAGPAQILK